MLFNSPVFLFLFLPFVLLVQSVIGRRFKNTFLLIVSLFFYAWGETFYLVLILWSIGISYVVGLCISRARSKKFNQGILFLGLLANMGSLMLFKYANFFVANMNILISMVGLPTFQYQPVHLPIGLSFFTFQAMSYLIDVYKGRVGPQRNPINFALYISLFPQLIAGPIVRYRDIASQLINRVRTPSQTVYGIKRFIIGLGKKVLLADVFSSIVDEIFGLATSDMTTGLAWLGILLFSLQIYFDFSGYSDMAIGLCRIFGFRIKENFNYPYVAQSLRDFWNRWHISLSTWLRDYLYIPLGGNQGGKYQTGINILLVFFLGGLWHGAGWNFVLWGLWHGSVLLVERSLLKNILEKVGRPVRHIYLVGVVLIGWVFFRTDSFIGAMNYLAAMAWMAEGNGLKYNLGLYLDTSYILTFLVGLMAITPIKRPLLRGLRNLNKKFNPEIRPIVKSFQSSLTLLTLLGILIWSIAGIAAGTFNPFLYFRF